jgi:toxin ParE1/3/4
VKRYRVRIVEDAEQDLIDIFQYVATHDSVEKAAHVIDQLEALCLRLSTLSEGGHVPPEQDRIGVTNYREVHFKPYRVIYEIIGQEVFAHCVLDGRRDMQTLLERRLVR